MRYRDRRTAGAAAREYADAMDGYGGWGEFPPLTVVELAEPFAWTVDDPEEEEKASRSPLVRERYHGRDLPQIKKEYPAGTFVLAGGFTRCEAADLAGVKEAAVVVYKGTWEDARRLAWKENAKNGQQRSSGDLQLVLIDIHGLPGMWDRSTRDVADLADCHHSAVARFRDRHKPVADPPAADPAAAEPGDEPIVSQQRETTQPALPIRGTRKAKAERDEKKARREKNQQRRERRQQKEHDQWEREQCEKYPFRDIGRRLGNLVWEVQHLTRETATEAAVRELVTGLKEAVADFDRQAEMTARMAGAA